MKFFFGVKEFFSWILILKMDVKMNLRIITKNHAADSKIGFPLKSILKSIGLRVHADSLGVKSF